MHLEIQDMAMGHMSIDINSIASIHVQPVTSYHNHGKQVWAVLITRNDGTIHTVYEHPEKQAADKHMALLFNALRDKNHFIDSVN